MSFSSTISYLRNKAGLTQQEVAGGIGVAKATYVKIENGDREPKLDEIRALGEFYEVDTVSLIDGVDMVNEPLGQSYKREEISSREEVKLNEDKLRQVLLYISEQVGAKPNVGATVINKLLYFTDFDYYEKYGESVTGLTYIRNHFGPTADIRVLSGTIDQMRIDGELEVVETEHFKHKQKKYLPRHRANLAVLNAQELDHINDVLDRLGDKNATELSELSHKDTPWVVTPAGEPIDYQLAMYRTAATSVREDDGVEL